MGNRLCIAAHIHDNHNRSTLSTLLSIDNSAGTNSPLPTTPNPLRARAQRPYVRYTAQAAATALGLSVRLLGGSICSHAVLVCQYALQTSYRHTHATAEETATATTNTVHTLVLQRMRH